MYAEFSMITVSTVPKILKQKMYVDVQILDISGDTRRSLQEHHNTNLTVVFNTFWFVKLRGKENVPSYMKSQSGHRKYDLVRILFDLIPSTGIGTRQVSVRLVRNL